MRKINLCCSRRITFHTHDTELPLTGTETRFQNHSQVWIWSQHTPAVVTETAQQMNSTTPRPLTRLREKRFISQPDVDSGSSTTCQATGTAESIRLLFELQAESHKCGCEEQNESMEQTDINHGHTKSRKATGEVQHKIFGELLEMENVLDTEKLATSHKVQSVFSCSEMTKLMKIGVLSEVHSDMDNDN